MKRLMIGATLLALLTSPVAAAQPGQNRDQPRHESRDDRGRDMRQHEGRQWHPQAQRWDNGRHRGWGRDRGPNARWGRGQQMGYNDWRNSRRINYRRYNLRQPPRGYEWRRSDDRFLMVAIASGIIASVVLSSRR